MRDRDLPAWVQQAVLVAAYVALASWGEAVAVDDSVTLWYPPPGLAVAAVVLGGARFVLPTIVAELIVSLVVFEVAADLGTALAIGNAVLVGGSYALVGWVLGRLLPDPSVPDLRSLGVLAGGLAVGAVPGALLGSLVLLQADVLDGAQLWTSMRTWYQGDAIGMLSVAPAIVLGVSVRRSDRVLAPRPPLRSPLGALEVASVVLVPIATGLLVDRVDMLYLSLAPIVLVALRRAHPGSAIAGAVIAGIVPTVLAARGAGAFDRGDVVVLLAVVALTGMVMGLVVAARFRADHAVQQLGVALANSGDFVVLADADGMPTWWNDAAGRFIRVGPDGAPAPVRDALDGGEEAKAELLRRVRSGDTWRGEVALVDREDRTVPASLVVIPETGPEGDVCGFAMFARDVSAERAYEDELTRHVLYDRLTGVANRALLRARLTQAVAKARDDGQHAALVLLDLDRFKLVNDVLGPSEADDLLRAVAERLSRGLPGSHTVARLGGDEFTILAEGIDDPSEALRVAQGVVDALATPFPTPAGEIAVSASLGIVAVGPDLSPDEVLRRADLAMYRAKGSGGGRYVVYDEAMSAVAARRHRIEACLREVLAAPDVPLHYQPVVDTATGAVHFAEALLRLELADLGRIPPPEVLAVAQQIGRMDELGELIIHTAARAAAGWPGSIGVSVNVSPVQLRDGDLPRTLQRACAAAGLPTDRIIVELTEDAFFDDRDRAADVLRECRELGVRIALDDFGSGFSSLSVLRSLPIDILKLDGGLLDGIADSPPARAIIRAVTGVAEALGLEVVAEAIETDEQLSASRELGCRFGQGYLLGVPAPASELGAPAGTA